MMTLTQARATLQRMTAAVVDPMLSDDEIEDLLFAARRPARPAWLQFAWPLYTAESVLPLAIIPPDAYREWLPLTPYAVGDRVTPPVRNQHVYQVTVAGTSGTTPPVWPTTSGATVSDATVMWAEAGPAVYTLTWDLNAAAAEGWRWKLGKVTNRVTFTAAGQQTISQDQFTTHCEKMVAFYQRKMATTVPLRGGFRRDRFDGATNGWDW